MPLENFRGHFFPLNFYFSYDIDLANHSFASNSFKNINFKVDEELIGKKGFNKLSDKKVTLLSMLMASYFN